jgi:hypothetical protein
LDGLVACGPEQEAELLQLLEARASVRVQVTLVEVLAEVRLLASEPLAGEVEARSEVVEGLPVVVAPSDDRAEHREVKQARAAHRGP